MPNKPTLGMLKRDGVPTWLFETLHRLIESQNQTTASFGAIIRGETPDGSGGSLIDTSKFFYKPGLPGGQLAYGSTAAGESLTLSSTANGSKGFIFLGDAKASAYWEANDRLGIGTAAPAAKAHLNHTTGGGTQTILPGTGTFSGSWGIAGGTTPLAVLGTNDGDTSFIQSGTITNLDVAFRMASFTAPATSPYVIHVVARKTGVGTIVNPVQMVVSTNAADFSLGAGTIITNVLSMVPTTVTTSYVDYTYTLTPSEVTALAAGSSNWWINFRAGTSNTDVFNITQVFMTVPGNVNSTPLLRFQNPVATLDETWVSSTSSTGVDLGFSGSSPFFFGNGPAAASGVRIYSDATTGWIEAGSLAASNLNLHLSGNTQSKGTLLTLDFITTKATGVFQLAGSTSGLFTQQAAATTTSYTVIWPNAQGGASTFLKNDGAGNLSWGTPVITNILLDGSNHTDTVNTAVARGMMIVGNATPKWSGLAIGTAGTFLRSSGTDPSWQLITDNDVGPGGTLARLAASQTFTGSNLFSPGTSNIFTLALDVGAYQSAGLEFTDGTFNAVLTAPGAGFSGVRFFSFPDGDGQILIQNATQNVGVKTLLVNNKIRCNTSSGTTWQDNTDTTKQMRMDLSGIATGATRNEKRQDYSGSLVLVGNTAAAVGVLGTTNLTAQTASIGSTTLLSSSATSSGIFRVTFYLVTTTAGSAGDTVKVTVSYNDGAAQTVDVPLTVEATGAPSTGQTLDLSVLNKAVFGEVVVYSAASNAITFTTTVVKTGSPQYTIRARIQALG